MSQRNLLVLGSALVAIAAFLALPSAQPFVGVPAGSAGVKLRGGEVVGVANPGWSSKVPFLERLQLVTTRPVTHSGPLITARSSDGLLFELRLATTFAPNIDAIPALYARNGADFSGDIDRRLPQLVRQVVSEQTGEGVLYDRLALEGPIGKRLAAALAPDLQIEGVIVEAVEVAASHSFAAEALARKRRQLLDLSVQNSLSAAAIASAESEAKVKEVEERLKNEQDEKRSAAALVRRANAERQDILLDGERELAREETLRRRLDMIKDYPVQSAKIGIGESDLQVVLGASAAPAGAAPPAR